jgi:hypothetical protein
MIINGFPFYWEAWTRRLPGWTIGYDLRNVELMPSVALQLWAGRVQVSWLSAWIEWSWCPITRAWRRGESNGSASSDSRV